MHTQRSDQRCVPNCLRGSERAADCKTPSNCVIHAGCGHSAGPAGSRIGPSAGWSRRGAGPRRSAAPWKPPTTEPARPEPSHLGPVRARTVTIVASSSRTGHDRLSPSPGRRQATRYATPKGATPASSARAHVRLGWRGRLGGRVGRVGGVGVDDHQLVHQRRLGHQGPVQRADHARHRALLVPSRYHDADPGAVPLLILQQLPEGSVTPVRGPPTVPGLGAVVHGSPGSSLGKGLQATGKPRLVPVRPDPHTSPMRPACESLSADPARPGRRRGWPSPR